MRDYWAPITAALAGLALCALGLYLLVTRQEEVTVTSKTGDFCYLVVVKTGPDESFKGVTSVRPIPCETPTTPEKP